ncbi:hypothetical protein OZJ19_28310, partial [Escherichia coli]|uniref:hypothetical protein n=1 Tax=Escherichia coli TaxID=562 RepID=UPI002284AC1A
VSAASLTLTIPDTPVSLNLTPTQEGAFAKSNASTVSVKTDNKTGYTLSIASKNEYNGLNNGSSKLVSIGASLSEDNYKSEGNLNTWAYMPSKL